MKTDFAVKTAPAFLFLALPLLFAAACGGGGSSAASSAASSSATGSEAAIVATQASDWSSGSFSIVYTSPATSARNTLKAYVSSDLAVFASGSSFFVMGRYFADFVERFEMSGPSASVYHYSTIEGSEKSMNPQAMIFASQNKAYITRLQSSVQWIVNPAAASESAFKTGTLDLGAYDDGDGSPEAVEGLVAGNRLFICLQRLDQRSGWTPNSTAYVAVFDTGTDAELDTRAAGSSSALKGIALPAKNPGRISYCAENGLIYVQCTGKLENLWAGTSAAYSGGIVAIDPAKLQATLVVDDGTDASPLYGGNIYKMAIVSATKGYLAVYRAWGALDLRTFNPSTGVVGGVVSGFSGADIRDLTVDGKARLWILTAKGATILDTSSESVVQADLDLGLMPSSIVFARY